MSDTPPSSPPPPPKTRKPLWQRLIVSTLRITLGLIVLMPLVAWFFGRSFIYHPTNTAEPAIDRTASRPGWRRHTCTSDGQTLVGLQHVPEATTSAPWIVFWGGNAAPIVDNAHIMNTVRGHLDLGIDVHAYRGYDGSTGTPTESALLADARNQLAQLMDEEQLPASRLVLIGQSLGSGVAARMAAELCDRSEPPAALVLLSPYSSMSQVFDDSTWPLMVGWAAADTWRTDAVIGNVSCPTLIVHGADDTLIRPSHGHALAERLGDTATMLVVPTGHGDVWDEAAFRATREFIVEQAGPVSRR